MKIVYNEQEIDKLVKIFEQKLNQISVFTFTGPLGAGKSTLIRAILRSQGITETITSPTFTYVNYYKNQQGKTFYHFDLYRLQTSQDFMQAGFDEYLYAPESWSFVEWPAIIMPLLSERVCHSTLDYEGLDKRIIEIICKNYK